MTDYLALLLGVACAAGGGELFVRGTVGLAQWMRIAPGIIGATVAAFATSSPELSVAVSSALAGRPQITLGDALGSNVVNIGLVLGIALVISGIHSSRASVKRDYPAAMLVPVITAGLVVDGVLSRVDGVILLSVFIVWLTATIIEARHQRSATAEVLGDEHPAHILLLCAAGLGLLVAAGMLIVAGARGLALAFGVDEFIIGATLVAIGTSAPELATAIVAKLKGHDEVGLGTLLGSNIFNGLFIIAVAAIITPITVDLREVAVALIFGLLTVAITFPSREGLIDRRRGVMLLVLYAVYVAAILQQLGV